MRAWATTILPVILLSAACAQEAEPDPDANAPAATPAPAPASPDPAAAGITAEVKGSGAGSAITGQAQVTPTAEGFDLMLMLSGAPAGPHAWHIHQAACGVSGAPIVVALSEKPGQPAVAAELEVAADGTVHAQAKVPSSMLTVDQLRTGDYSLHVHQTGGAQHGPSIACADL